jgi:carbon monoxide dehydrogenase subunit G
MRIENSFQVPVAPSVAWSLLTDLPRVADCLPGAKLTEAVDERTYRGEVGIKLGPVGMNFQGEMRFTELDEGNADADIEFSLSPDEQGTHVAIVTELMLTGQAAQYGRASGVVKKLSEFMIGRFAKCLRQRLDAVPGPRT